MDNGVYWAKKLKKYTAADWAGKPSLFVQEARPCFPGTGRVLELGCGTGDDGLWLAEQGYDVTQTDFIDDLFPDITLRAQDAGVKVDLQKLDSRQLSALASKTYDVVFANLSLHYFDMATTKAIFAEIHRILKPGGVFAGLFNSTDDPETTEGEQLEENFYHINGIDKRFFDVATAQQLTKSFTPLVINNKGNTYKDRAKGIQNLVQIIVQK
jgi:ubiquinone/menaquinone biosynthesis C-methylase UbiE